MSEREALALVQPTTYVRDLAARNGALKASIRAALVVIDLAGVDK